MENHKLIMEMHLVKRNNKAQYEFIVRDVENKNALTYQYLPVKDKKNLEKFLDALLEGYQCEKICFVDLTEKQFERISDNKYYKVPSKVMDKYNIEVLNSSNEFNKVLEDYRKENVCKQTMSEYKKSLLEDFKKNIKSHHSWSEELRNDKEFMKEAIKINIYSIIIASDKLKSDRDLIMEACTKEPILLRSVKVESEELALDLVKANPECIKELPGKYSCNPEFVKKAVEEVPKCFKYADYFNHNKSFIKELISEQSNKVWLLSYMDGFLKNDPEFMLELIKIDEGAFKYASDELKDKKDFVMKAIDINYFSMYFASDRLRDNYYVVKAAVSKEPSMIEYASKRVQEKIKNNKPSLDSIIKQAEDKCSGKEQTDKPLERGL